MSYSGPNQENMAFVPKGATGEKMVKKGFNAAGNWFSFFWGEAPAIRSIISATNWLPVSIFLGTALAATRLILVNNPSICYLYAENQVNGFLVTLPEAMAAVIAWSWFNLLLSPLLLILILITSARLMWRISRWLRGAGSFNHYFGMVTGCALLLIAGQIAGYIIVNAQDLKNLNDLRDLTPGVGLGLLPLFTPERIGLFYHEIVRGFDLFGIWVIKLLAAMFQAVEDFGKGKSLLLAVGYYCAFIAVRWALEGYGSQLWRYFWNFGNY